MSNDEREDLLFAWMNMNMRIRGNRLLKTLSFNEMLVLSLIYRNDEAQLPPMTAASIGEKMRLLKSEMNKLLSGMEKKQLILRKQSDADRRKIELRINPAMLPVYLEEHARVLRYLDRIAGKIGTEQTLLLARLLEAATDAVDEEANNQ